MWISLTSAEHKDHPKATAYWQDEAKGPVVFCRTTALGLVRVLSGRYTVGGDPLRFDEAWQRYQQWREDSQVVFAEEPKRVEEEFAGLVKANLVTSKNSTDAYLAAFAIAAGLRLVTLDPGFKRFTDLDLLLL